jgi:HK97 family phage portal protein
METLRRILAEEQAMGDYREGFWTNAARMGGIIERPREAPEWSATARERFKAEFEALYSGASKSGATAILEEGMQWKQISFSAQESEYLGARKLTREECARAYHIPLPMVGILDNATFSKISEQHKNIYQDCMGPWLKMIEEEIELQLLPWLTADKDVYCEFNIARKLSGSFEEQTRRCKHERSPVDDGQRGRARFHLPSLPATPTIVVRRSRVDRRGRPALATPTRPNPKRAAPRRGGGRSTRLCQRCAKST